MKIHQIYELFPSIFFSCRKSGSYFLVPEVRRFVQLVHCNSCARFFIRGGEKPIAYTDLSGCVFSGLFYAFEFIFYFIYKSIIE
jgi:hypothetical protein